MTGKSFDDYVAGDAKAAALITTLPFSRPQTPSEYIQAELFGRRNRIAHWGYVNSTQDDAILCHSIAVIVISILRKMDLEKYAAV
jgi:hypothetical protein